MKIALWSIGCVLLAGLLGLAWLVVMYPNEPPPPRASKTVAIELDEHSTVDSVARQFGSAGLVADTDLFAWYARAMRASDRLRQGRVLVTAQMTPRQLLQRVATGFGSTQLRITIPEGWNRFDIALRLAEWGVCTREAFLAQVGSTRLPELDPAAQNGEGYLFPDTYWLHDDMQPAQVVERLTNNARRRLSMLQAAEAAGFERLRTEFGFGVHEIVILASIVEKEAHVASEQPVIAGVFLNRLRDPQFRPKRLQADPTVAYGCLVMQLASCSDFDGKRVTRTMTADPENPFNTYRIEGLPPAPIANPGLSALRAVLAPAAHSYLYFVARRDGHHAFSANLADHNLAVQQVQLAAAAGGP